jgi:hypothetical protein
MRGRLELVHQRSPNPHLRSLRGHSEPVYRSPRDPQAQVGTFPTIGKDLRFIRVPKAYLSHKRGRQMSYDEEQVDSLHSAFGPAIEAELAVLASIEARYWDELTKLETSALPSSVKDHLREQLEAKRNSAREPHVIRLAQLHDEQTMRSLLSVKTTH